MKRECLVVAYSKVGGSWKETSREERGNIICDVSHWREWGEFDRNLGGSARCTPLSPNSSIMFEYITISPSRNEKLVYKFHGPVVS